MDPIDYNNKLADVRKNYRTSINEVRDENEKRLSHIEDTHKYQRGKQRESYDGQIKEYESKNKEAGEYFSKKASDVIRKKNRQLRDTLQEERKEFEDTNGQMRRKMSKKLDVLKDSFTRAKDEMSKANEQSIRQTKRLAQDRIDHTHEQSAETTRNLVDTHKKSFNKHNEDVKRRKNKMVRGHKLAIGKQVDEDAAARKRISKTHQRETKGLQGAYRDSLSLNQEQYKDQVDHLKQKSKIENAHQTEAYESLAKISGDRNQTDTRRTTEMSQDQLRTMQKRFAKQTNDLKRSTASQISAADDKLVGFRQKNRMLEEREHIKERTHRKDLEEAKFDGKRKLKIANDDFATELRDRSDINSKSLEKQSYAHHKALNKIHEKIRDGHEGLVSRYKEEITDLNRYYTNKATEEQRVSGKVLHNQRKDFSKAIKMVTDNNERYVRELKDQYTSERKGLALIARDNVYERSQAVREELTNKFDKAENQLQSKIGIMDNENLRMEMRMNNKLKIIRGKFMDEVKQQQQMEDARRVAERSDLKKMIEGINEQHYRTLLETKSNFDREMLKTKSFNAHQLTELTSDYERQLRTGRINQARDMKVNLGEARDRYDRMKNDYDTRLSAMKIQYETKLEKLKNSTMEMKNIESLRLRSEKREA